MEDFTQEEIFLTEYGSYKNGNITLFKKWLGQLSTETILKFIKWLQAEGLTI
jgi:hypothetical protein